MNWKAAGLTVLTIVLFVGFMYAIVVVPYLVLVIAIPAMVLGVGTMVWALYHIFLEVL